jgi:hypothetical protein
MSSTRLVVLSSTAIETFIPVSEYEFYKVCCYPLGSPYSFYAWVTIEANLRLSSSVPHLFGVFLSSFMDLRLRLKWWWCAEAMLALAKLLALCGGLCWPCTARHNYLGKLRDKTKLCKGAEYAFPKVAFGDFVIGIFCNSDPPTAPSPSSTQPI